MVELEFKMVEVELVYKSEDRNCKFLISGWTICYILENDGSLKILWFYLLFLLCGVTY